MSAIATVACDACGKHYKWKPELASKRVKCKCGGRVHFPKDDPSGMAGDSEDRGLLGGLPADEVQDSSGTRVVPAIEGEEDGEYDLGNHTASTKPALKGGTPAMQTCPNCKKPVVPQAVICTGCGTNLKTGKRLATSVLQERPSASASQSEKTQVRPAWIEWLGLIGVVAVIGVILAVIDFSAPKTGMEYSGYVFIGGLIVWTIGTIWGIRAATVDNFALRLACRFIPFVGWVVIVKRSIQDWETMKTPVMVIIFGISVAITSGLCWIAAVVTLGPAAGR